MDIRKLVTGTIFSGIKNIITEKLSKHLTESGTTAEGGELPFCSGTSRWDWRNISRDIDEGEVLDASEHREILKRAYSSWCRNPLAGQIVNLTTWFVMGKGISFKARNSKVQKILKAFWDDPDNDLAVMQHWMSNELQIYGEIFLRFFANPISGQIRMAMVDPLEIEDVVTEPDNIRKPVAYLRKYRKRVIPDDWKDIFRKYGDEVGTEDEVVREVIPADEILHVRVNNVSNRTRGLSELYRVLPWLDAYERWLEDRVNINRARGTFAFLRKVPAIPSRVGGPFDVDSVTGKYRVPKPGSILVVHEGETWEVLSPTIGADDAREDGRALKLMVAAGSGIFEHYFGDPSTGNRATTRSMELPMVKKFEDRQRLFEEVFGKIFQRVIEAGIQSGILKRTVDRTVDVNFPPIIPEDMEVLTRILIKQVEAEILSRDSARRMIPWIADPSREAGVISDEIQDREQRDEE